MPAEMTRRDFSVRIARVGTAAGLLARPAAAYARDEISHAAESIHQEVTIKASPTRVYDALTDGTQFTKVTAFSPVMNAAPARIGRAAGESFTLFGGHIIGRQVELVPAR